MKRPTISQQEIEILRRREGREEWRNFEDMFSDTELLQNFFQHLKAHFLKKLEKEELTGKVLIVKILSENFEKKTQWYNNLIFLMEKYPVLAEAYAEKILED